MSVRSRGDPGKSLEFLDEMSLVVVVALQSNVGQIKTLVVVEQTFGANESLDTAIGFWRNAETVPVMTVQLPTAESGRSSKIADTLLRILFLHAQEEIALAGGANLHHSETAIEIG